MSAQPREPEIHRLLPQACDAERGVLCSLLLQPREVSGICEENAITPEFFHLPAHALVYRRAMEQIGKDGTTDIVTLTELLRDRNELDHAGGAGLVTEHFTYLPTATNVRFYLKQLQEKHTLRRIIMVGTEYASRSYEEQGESEALLDGFEKAVGAIRKSDDGELREMEPKDAIMEVIANIEDLYERRGAVSGLTTGFPELDQTIDGMHKGEMIVIAARPSMGKTALAMNIAEHIAYVEKKTVVVFTLEMSIPQLYQRVLLSRSRVNLSRVRMGFLADADFPKLTAITSMMAESSKLRIVDAIGASINAIRAKARRMAKKHPDLACIVIDYLQKAKSNSKQAQGSREREISEISGGVKDLGKELNIPIVVLAQLNREVDKRTGASRGRPRLSDLRESGSIEQDADVIGLLTREELYAENDEEKSAAAGKATLIIAKQRNGPIGDIPLTFLNEFARFVPRARDEEEPAEKRNWHKE